MAIFGPGGLAARAEAKNTNNQIYLLPLGELYCIFIGSTNFRPVPPRAVNEEFERLSVIQDSHKDSS